MNKKTWINKVKKKEVNMYSWIACPTYSWTILFCPHCRWWCHKKMIRQTTEMHCTTTCPGTFLNKCGLAKGHRDWKTWNRFTGCGPGMAITHWREESKENERWAQFGALTSFVPGQKSCFKLEVALSVLSYRSPLFPFITKTQSI